MVYDVEARVNSPLTSPPATPTELHTITKTAACRPQRPTRPSVRFYVNA